MHQCGSHSSLFCPVGSPAGERQVFTIAVPERRAFPEQRVLVSAETLDARAILGEARAQLSGIASKPAGQVIGAEIARLLAWVGDYDEAAATARMDAYPSLAYRELARIRAARGDVSEALSLIDSMSFTRDRKTSVRLGPAE
jgi:hypothetical protein